MQLEDVTMHYIMLSYQPLVTIQIVLYTMLDMFLMIACIPDNMQSCQLTFYYI